MKLLFIFFYCFNIVNCFSSNLQGSIDNPSKKTAQNYYDEFLKMGDEAYLTDGGKSLLLETWKLSNKEKADTLILYASNYLRDVYVNEYNFDSAIYYSHGCIKQLKKAYILDVDIINNIILASIYGTLDEPSFDSSLYYFGKAEKLIKENKNLSSPLIVEYYLKKHDVFFIMRQYDESLILLDELSAFVKGKNIKNIECKIFDRYSNIYDYMGVYDKAILYGKRSIECIQDNEEVLAQYYLKLADLYLLLEQKDSALSLYKKVIAICEKPTMESFSSYTYMMVINSEVFTTEENKIYFSRIEESSLTGEVLCLYYLTKAKVSDSIEEQKKYCEQVINCGNNLYFKANAYWFLYNIYKEHNPRESLKYFELYNKLNDSITKEEGVVKLSNTVVLSEASKEYEYNSNKIIFRYLILIIVIIILFLALFFFYRNKNIKSKIVLLKEKENLIIRKEVINNELKEALLIIDNNVNLLNESKKELHYISQEKESSVRLKIFYDKINHYVLNFNRDKKINDKINEVKEDFIEKLENLTDLTKTEKKIILLLRLDMSSKEISNYLNVTEKTVEQYRYRIRKKFNVDKNLSLTDFLSSF